MEVYADAEGQVNGVDNLNQLNSTITVANSADGPFASTETAAWETPLNVTSNNEGRWVIECGAVMHRSYSFPQESIPYGHLGQLK